MSVKLPSNFDFDVDLGLDVSGIPTSYSFTIKDLPKIDVGIDPMVFKIEPVDLSLRLKEIPSVRAHFPVDYKVGLALFGTELACVRLCGQAQVITEPYVPNPCECRNIPLRRPVPLPEPQPPRPIPA